MPNSDFIDPAIRRGLIMPITVAALLAGAAWQLISVPPHATGARRQASMSVPVGTPAPQELRLAPAQVAKPNPGTAQR